MTNPAKVKSAQRTLRLLELLAQNRNGITFTEIQESLNIPKSSTFNLIQELLDNNYIIYNDQKKLYYAGLEYIKLCTTCMKNTDLLEELSLLTSDIGKELNQTTHAGALDGKSIIYLAKYESNSRLSLMNNIGLKLPAHCTALGKILLTQYTDEEIKTLYNNYTFEKLTENSIDSLDRLLKELIVFKHRDYSEELCEASIYTACIALPIRVNGKIIAAVSLTLPIEFYKNKDIKYIVNTMKKHILNTESRLFA